MRVRDIMQSDLVSALPHLSARDACELMWARGFHHLPVVNERTEIIGMISDRDLLRRAVLQLKPRGEVLIRDATAHDIMTPDPTTVSPEATLKEALTMLLENHFSSLPVVEEGRLVGLITYTDVLRFVHQMLNNGD